jgi:hypothetical protein
MVCNTYGEIVHDEWKITEKKYAHIALDEFVVMPNHMHGIIQIVNRIHDAHPDDTRIGAHSGIGPHSGRDVARNVSTNSVGMNVAQTGMAGIEPPASPSGQKNGKMSAISPAPGSLSAIVRSFKSAVSMRVNEFRKTPGASVLQLRFHDHIIRNRQELFRIRQYIHNNPKNWGKDKFNNDGNTAVRENCREYEREIWMI